jgi:putative phosphoribosyl transferase
MRQANVQYHVRYHVREPSVVFEDREDAGRAIVGFMRPSRQPNSLVLGLPRGGVAVGDSVAAALDAPLEPLVVRKLPIPISPEMGFGAIAIDGTRVLNERAIASFGLTEAVIERVTEEVMDEVRRRARQYSGSDRPPDVSGRHVYIVDDGLATGFTAIVAAHMASRKDPASLTLAVPVSPISSLRAVQGLFDETYCLYAQESHPFAVASFYRDFHEMADSEVNRYLADHAARARPSGGDGRWPSLEHGSGENGVSDDN